jgi:hypothetical protein
MNDRIAATTLTVLGTLLGPETLRQQLASDRLEGCAVVIYGTYYGNVDAILVSRVESFGSKTESLHSGPHREDADPMGNPPSHWGSRTPRCAGARDRRAPR